MKKILLPAFLLFGIGASAQCTDLFFSEYLEGASNNKAIEIYNPTSAPIDLVDYVIYRYNNGSPTPTDSLFPRDIIAAGDVWVAGNPSAVAAILAQSDTLHTITFFNGDDALSLKKISTNTILDIIGLIGNDPGVNWPVGTGATSEFTLVRMVGVQQGNTNWAVAATEYDAYPQNTVTFLGSHTMTPCCSGPPALALSAQTNNLCFGDANGSITVNAPGSGITYSWVGRPETVPTLAGLVAGTYSAIATNSCGNDTLVVTITTPTALAATTMQTNVSCDGGSNGTAMVMVTGGTSPYTYSWAPSGGTAATATGLTPGGYTVTTTDANGCTRTDAFTITAPTALAATTMQTNITCNGGANGDAMVTVSGGTPGYSYSWSPSGGTAAMASNLTAGGYTVTTTDANGCTRTDAVTITEPSAIASSFTQTNPTCFGSTDGSVTVIANGGVPSYTYSWSSGGTFATETGLADGSYTVTITDANGCTHANTAVLTQPGPVVVTVSLPTDTACEFTGQVVLGGESPAGGTWSGTGVTSNMFDSGQPSGMYYVITYTFTDSAGCSGSAIDSIWVDLCLGILSPETNGFSVAPNPFTEIIQLQFTTMHNVISVYNIQGEIVYTETVNSLSSSMNLGTLAAGIYTVKVENESGVTVKKIQKVD